MPKQRLENVVYFNSFNSAQKDSSWRWPCFYCSDQKSNTNTDNTINQNVISPYEQGGTCFYKGNLINSPYITDLRVSNQVLQKCKLEVGTCPVQYVNCKWVYIFGRRSVPLKTKRRYIPYPESEPERAYYRVVFLNCHVLGDNLVFWLENDRFKSSFVYFWSFISIYEKPSVPCPRKVITSTRAFIDKSCFQTI